MPAGDQLKARLDPCYQREMLLAALIVSIIFELVMIRLSVRANARFREEKHLPMQWSISLSKPFPETVTWSAPRLLALGFMPALAIGVFALVNIIAMTQTPRPGQEWMIIPAVIFTGSALVATHALHLWLIGKTLHRGGR